MSNHYDVIVIGVGMAGLNAARRTASAGKRVAVVDSRPYGGSCMLRGCDPKKVLVGAAEVLDWHQRMTGHGISGDLRIDWADLMAFKRTFTDPVPENLERSLSSQSVTTLHGAARFTGNNELQIGGATLSAEHIVIAAGARPRDLNIPGADLVATSTDFLELDELPDRIVFIGGGYVSFEFAHLAARAGAKVTIVERGQRPLKHFDGDLVERLVVATEELGVEVLLGTEATAVERVGGSLSVSTTPGDPVGADLVVHGAGRVPELDGLDLTAGGVEFDPSRGVTVSEYLQSVSNPAVYAAGDSAATAGWPLTPVAVHEGFIAASNIINGNQRKPDYAGTPSVAFTIPAIARAGLTEDEAVAEGLDFTVNHQETAGWYTARRTNEKHSAFKVLIENQTGRILGAHLLGAQAGEVIDMFALAIRNGLTARAIKTGMYVHPAAASDVTYML